MSNIKRPKTELERLKLLDNVESISFQMLDRLNALKNQNQNVNKNLEGKQENEETIKQDLCNPDQAIKKDWQI